MDYQKLSKEISYALRHAPWEYELELDEKGFVPIEQLLAALNESANYSKTVTSADLETAISQSDKKRHEIVGHRIRAIYGHSTPSKISYDPALPPSTLYHGTPRRSVAAIAAEGLKPMSRQYVHLSADIDTAIRVGSRRDSDPALLEIDAKAAYDDGLLFYQGNEKVWLAEAIPPSYIKQIE